MIPTKAQQFLAYRAYRRQIGRNAARVLAAARELFRELFPEAQIVVEPTSHGWIGILHGATCPHAGRYILRLSSYMRPGKLSVRIMRHYGIASTNPGQPILSGGWGVEVTRGALKFGGVHTWHGSHEVTAYPVPENEKRTDSHRGTLPA